MRSWMKKVFALCLFTTSFSCLAAPLDLQSLLSPATYGKACAQAAPTTSPAFCASFKTIAKCQCEQLSPRKEICNDMTMIYKIMMATFGQDLGRACKYQQDKQGGTDPQTCINDWNCYLNGGKDSHGGLCSGTGSRC